MLEDMAESANLMNWFVDHQMELLDVSLAQSMDFQVLYLLVSCTNFNFDVSIIIRMK